MPSKMPNTLLTLTSTTHHAISHGHATPHTTHHGLTARHGHLEPAALELLAYNLR